MDITVIAQAAVTAVIPYLVKGGEAIAKGIGKDLWELIKKPFTTDKEQAVIQALKTQPENQIVQGKVIGKLEELLESHPELVQRLTDLIKDSLKMQPESTQNISGRDNIGFNNVTDSKINIRRG